MNKPAERPRKRKLTIWVLSFMGICAAAVGAYWEYLVEAFLPERPLNQWIQAGGTSFVMFLMIWLALRPKRTSSENNRKK